MDIISDRVPSSSPSETTSEEETHRGGSLTGGDGLRQLAQRLTARNRILRRYLQSARAEVSETPIESIDLSHLRASDFPSVRVRGGMSSADVSDGFVSGVSYQSDQRSIFDSD